MILDGFFVGAFVGVKVSERLLPRQADSAKKRKKKGSEQVF
jgi:hypothetical protein